MQYEKIQDIEFKNNFCFINFQKSNWSVQEILRKRKGKRKINKHCNKKVH